MMRLRSAVDGERVIGVGREGQGRAVRVDHSRD